MTRKRLFKLAMGLGFSKRDVEEWCDCEFCKGKENKEKFIGVMVAFIELAQHTIKHPAYKGKYIDAVCKWYEGKITDGEVVRLCGHYYLANKDMVVIDRRVNK